MKALVIPDVHLKPWIFERAEMLMKAGKAERAVCLMDIPDDWGKGFQSDIYEETFDRAIAFAKAYPDTLWCYGNHDLSYVWQMQETGYSPHMRYIVMSKLDALKNALPDESRIAIIHRIDNVLFSHGGLSREYVLWAHKDLIDADTDELLEAINGASVDYLWDDISPLWLRPQYDKVTIYRNDRYTQVVGHTPVEVLRKENGVISTDVFSTYRDGRQIGESAMAVVDTESGEFEKVRVPGAR
ncbi:MAG: hypothetical protein IJL07_09880 [Lachnospiraceae bacterium]|nr:hypothetical protein [Lachnospiraceae bacterium]